ncbi:hypothetical protein CEK28_08965 [Xenophilus sp. AP218F]|nr:hypothetical protein CEK28_08965 [Xenophilus sp. AP218F]
MPPRARSQRGFALTLLVLLAGLALTAMLAGYLHRQYSQQALAQALRANSEAQLRAWTGAELLRAYLQKLPASERDSLTDKGARLRLDGGLASGIRLSLLPRARGSDLARATVTGLADGATATLDLVFRLQSSPAAPAQAPIQLSGGLRTSGDITVNGAGNAVLLVDGAVDSTGSLNGVEAIRATGEVRFNGAPPADGRLTLWSNGDIHVGSGDFLELRSQGDIDMGPGSRVGKAWANGALSSRGDLLETAWAHRASSLGGSVAVPREILLGGDLASASSAWIERLRILGKLTLRGDAKIRDGVVRGGSNHSPESPNVNVRVDPALTLSLPLVEPVRATRPHIDANDYRDQANYRVFWSADGAQPWQRIRVEVRHIHGMPDGVYRLGRSSADPKRNYLCQTLAADAEQCRPPAYRICDSDGNNGCLGDSAPSEWQLKTATGRPDQQEISPGVWFFEGNVKLYGHLRATLLASGDAVTSGDTLIWSLAASGPAAVCNNAAFPDRHPLNHCAADRNAFLDAHAALRSIALLAGSGSAAGPYRGGDIHLGAYSRVVGAVLAGNTLKTDGSSHIRGRVASALQRYIGKPPPADIANTLGAETVIDVSDLPPDADGGAGNGSGSTSVKLLWSRYR